MKVRTNTGAMVVTGQFSLGRLRRRAGLASFLVPTLVAGLAAGQATPTAPAAPKDEPPKSESGGSSAGSASLSLGGAEAKGTSETVQPSPEPAQAVTSGSSAPPATSAETNAKDASAASTGARAVPAYAGARAHRKEETLSDRYSKLPYMERYRPQRNIWEIGMFTGLLFPSSTHNLKVAAFPQEEFSSLALQGGGQLAYFPLTWLGAELEAFGAGGSTQDTELSAIFYGLRANAVFQLPLYSVVPFALIGGGTLGASSEPMGHDRDPAFHFGAGVKVPFNHRVSGRFDIRDTLTQKIAAENGKQTHHPEIHLGLTFTFERTAPPAVHEDRDYDGLYDGEDKCPEQGALTVDGCPLDSDGDGIVDPLDECPAVSGVEPTGCPNLDEDGDGVPVPTDKCPTEMGSDAIGCPDQDLDGDGISGAADICPKQPETRNGFEDTDGCPDEMPDAIKRFTGVIQGINFRQGTAEVEASSHETLDAAVKILAEFPSIRIEVSGHTSSEGKAERNQELSDQRAAAVRDYFIAKGIAQDRVVARGAGSSEPVADNATKEGQKQNRRIEFRVLSEP